MRKLTAIAFVLFLAVSATAAPNDSADRTNPVQRVIRQIKTIIHHVLEQPGVPVPQVNP